ncbi:MAG: Rpn family recombination-promoting nuclease/putative transposase, partial [Oscillospiraceae bacterium]|nr:Rpn family recombination-promoting nuclease/putative transposase [Oscillospiraceae bacterium]
DFVFKSVFGVSENIDILQAFLSSVLYVPAHKYGYLTIDDPHLLKNSVDSKSSVLDVRLHTQSGTIIHIEIQRQLFVGFNARTIFAQSKLVTEQLNSGRKWEEIHQVKTILITDALYISSNDLYHNQFRYRTAEGIELSDLVEINCLDLSKIPNDDGTPLWSWMRYIDSNEESVLTMLATKSPELNKAVALLREFLPIKMFASSMNAI